MRPVLVRQDYTAWPHTEEYTPCPVAGPAAFATVGAVFAVYVIAALMLPPVTSVHGTQEVELKNSGIRPTQ